MTRSEEITPLDHTLKIPQLLVETFFLICDLWQIERWASTNPIAGVLQNQALGNTVENGALHSTTGKVGGSFSSQEKNIAQLRKKNSLNSHKNLLQKNLTAYIFETALNEQMNSVTHKKKES